jgi:hypothetical protein
MRFGEPLRLAPVGQLRIGVDRLQVVIDGEMVLHDDANPASPEGWWRPWTPWAATASL